MSRCLIAVVCRSEEHTSELQSHHDLVCRLLLEKKKNTLRFVEIISSDDQKEYRKRIDLSDTGPLGTRTLTLRPELRGSKWVLLEFFFFNDTATTEIYTLSLHDALPI